MQSHNNTKSVNANYTSTSSSSSCIDNLNNCSRWKISCTSCIHSHSTNLEFRCRIQWSSTRHTVMAHSYTCPFPMIETISYAAVALSFAKSKILFRGVLCPTESYWNNMIIFVFSSNLNRPFFSKSDLLSPNPGLLHVPIVRGHTWANWHMLHHSSPSVFPQLLMTVSCVSVHARCA